MKRFVSPLRYPGGKGKMHNIIKDIIIHNNYQGHVYTEPFAGGAAIGLKLLLNNTVNKILINDLDISIYSLWYSILNITDEFIKKIEETSITIDEWHKQHEIQKNKSAYSILELGFSTFFLNRTNRSGIILGGPIGGYHQSGKFLIDCRFNKNDLINRIITISALREKIELTNLDASVLIEMLDSRDHDYFINMDPPYYLKGRQLYMNYFKHEDHVILKDKISKSRHPWIITYDNVLEISKIYEGYSKLEFTLHYSAGNSKIGKELLIYQDNIKIKENIFERNKK